MSLVLNENVTVLRTKQKADPPSWKIGSQALSLKLHVQSSRKMSKMATLHPAKGIGGTASVGGSVSMLLADDGTSIWLRDRSFTVGFERLFLWPITKTNSRLVEVSNIWKLLAFVGHLLCRMGTRGCYQPDRKSIIQAWVELAEAHPCGYATNSRDC